MLSILFETQQYPSSLSTLIPCLYGQSLLRPDGPGSSVTAWPQTEATTGMIAGPQWKCGSVTCNCNMHFKTKRKSLYNAIWYHCIPDAANFERHQNFRVPWVISLWVFGCHGLPGWLRHGRQKPLCSKGSKRVLSKPMELISHITTFDSTL